MTPVTLSVTTDAWLSFTHHLMQTLVDHAEFTDAMFNNMVDGLIIIDDQGNIMRLNPAAEAIFGYKAREVLDKNIHVLMPSPYRMAHDSYIKNYQDTGEARIIGIGREVEGLRRDGSTFPMELAVSELSNAGKPYYLGMVRDISRRRQAEDEINQLAFYDSLTGLANRRLLRDRLDHAISTAHRAGDVGAVLFIDLDNFKHLNDTAGHDVGDSLLRHVARRLLGAVREGDTVARLGGDEFVIILEAVGTGDLDEAARHAEGVADVVREALNQPYRLRTLLHRCSPSIGVTLFYCGKESTDILLKQADMAMYEAKAAGRNAIRFFDPDMQRAVNERAHLEQDLRTAIRDGQLRLYLQSQVDTHCQVIGAEALIRWQHHERGLLSPAAFIPLAEDTGLIIPIGQWVLEQSCQLLAHWATQPDKEHLTLSVNVSVRQFMEPDFVTSILAALDATGAPPNRLKLELTESLLAKDLATVVAKMNDVKRWGVRLSMDDFGTGYSSLSYLRQLPLNQLKIDQSFVRHIVSSDHDAAIADMILSLASHLDLSVVAEGVETHDQRNRLEELGCRQFQGYLFGRPVPVAEW
ncbi:putative bifunctional diguanylate cyclase/phosphodiesterase [Salinispirillum marinum]|uniref:Bifunctional diguanylate cyclase/phosphodiesterase n=2 Tax=Saccharospirillaceae TaxID=255527 RepID=A0ABV8BDE3_9GAMM